MYQGRVLIGEGFLVRDGVLRFTCFGNIYQDVIQYFRYLNSRTVIEGYPKCVDETAELIICSATCNQSILQYVIVLNITFTLGTTDSKGGLLGILVHLLKKETLEEDQ